MTSKALMKLASQYNVDLPIVGSVYRALFEGYSVKEQLDSLFVRKVKKEF